MPEGLLSCGPSQWSITHWTITHVRCVPPPFPDPAVHTRSCGDGSEYKCEEFSLAEKKGENVKCAVRECPSALGTLMKGWLFWMKKDKEVAYRGSDMEAGSWRRGRIFADGEGWKGIPGVGNRMSKDTTSMEPWHGGGRSIQAWKGMAGGQTRHVEQATFGEICEAKEYWHFSSNRELSKAGSGIIASTLGEWLGVKLGSKANFPSSLVTTGKSLYSSEPQIISCNTLATWCKEPTLWKRPWCWETLKAGGEGGGRGWDGWMASPPQCTWVWTNSGR